MEREQWQEWQDGIAGYRSKTSYKRELTSEEKQFLESIENKIPSESVDRLRQRLKMVSEEKSEDLMYLPLKKPITILIVSIFFGWLGVDRFMIGDVGLGVCKLLFGWLTFGIWPIIDIFCCYKKAKDVNVRMLLAAL